MAMLLENEAGLDIAALLLAEDSAARAGLIASAIVQSLPDCACVVHRIQQEDGETVWNAIGIAGDLSIEQASLTAESLLPGRLYAEKPQPVVYGSAEIRREDYSHVHVTRSVSALAYLPLFQDGDLVGAIEIISYSSDLHLNVLAELEPIADLASPAILAGEAFEEQRQNLLDSIHRMTQLYDLEKSLNSTLEMDSVIALIPAKARTMVDCQAMHLWMFDGDTLTLSSSSGEDETVQPGMKQRPGEGYVADMGEEGEPLRIDDAEDERLRRRNAALPADGSSAPVTSALLVALMQDGSEVGVLEAINKTGRPFDEDDEFLLISMAETVSSALKNASLMLAERKLEILEALVRVSTEITSTLRLDRLLQIIVNSPQNVLPFELCAIALDNRGRLQLKAVSGKSSLPVGDTEVDELHTLVRWLSSQEEPLHIRHYEATDARAKSGIPAELARHFEATGYRALYSLPLTDDQGRVGVLLYESSDPDFLNLPHTEMIKVLAGQATVAIRNALLYRQVPLINLLEPLVHRKQALLRSNSRRRLSFAFGLAALVLFLVFCPLPMRVSGTAVVAPQHLVTIAAPVDGNVASVFAHEGERVAAGQVLGAMNDWQWRSAVASSEAKYQEAALVMESDLARGSARAGVDRAQVEYLRAEAARARMRLANAQLRSPIAGIVVTSNLQNAAGEHLDAGASFAQVLDLSSAVVDIAIAQSNDALLRVGQHAAIKLDSYPQLSWHDAVAIVSPEARATNGERTFTARVPLPNKQGLLRAGMTGRGKIFIGFRPAGYVLLRGPALWTWKTLWDWIGW